MHRTRRAKHSYHQSRAAVARSDAHADAHQAKEVLHCGGWPAVVDVDPDIDVWAKGKARAGTKLLTTGKQKYIVAPRRRSESGSRNRHGRSNQLSQGYLLGESVGECTEGKQLLACTCQQPTTSISTQNLTDCWHMFKYGRPKDRQRNR